MTPSDSSESIPDNDPSAQLIRNDNNMEARAERQKTRQYGLLYGLTTTVGAVLVVLTFVWCVTFRGGFSWNSDPAHQFNWHPLLMTVGMLFLFAQSMLVYRTGRSRPKMQLKLWHGCVHAISFVLSVIGLKAAFDSHNYANPPKANLYTLHSWLGLITVILFSGQLLLGFTCFLYPGLSQTLRAAILPIHRHSGIAIFTFALITTMMGYTQKAIWALPDTYSAYAAEGILINFLGLLAVSFGALALYLVNEVSYKRDVLPEEEMTLTGQRQTSD